MRRVTVAAGLAAAAGGLVLAGVALSAETITYKYDAKGRVIQVIHSGTINNNIVSNYTFDDADNRTRVKVTGAP